MSESEINELTFSEHLRKQTLRNQAAKKIAMVNLVAERHIKYQKDMPNYIIYQADYDKELQKVLTMQRKINRYLEKLRHEIY